MYMATKLRTSYLPSTQIWNSSDIIAKRANYGSIEFMWMYLQVYPVQTWEWGSKPKVEYLIPKPSKQPEKTMN